LPQTSPHTAARRFACVTAVALMTIVTLTGCNSGTEHNANPNPPASSGSTGSTTPPPSSTPPAATSSVTLNWSMPTQNVDGTPLTDLAGYKVYYGQESANMKSVVDVRGATVTTAVVEKLAPGRWYFALSSYTADGVESVQTGVVSTLVGST
jgi:hypothetical protein